VPERVRRVPALALLLAVVAIAAAACGGGGDSGGAVAGTVTVVGPWTGRDAQSFESVAQRFMESYPGTKVVYTYVGDRLRAKLAAAADGGTLPDVAAVGQPRLMRELAEQDLLAPLDYLKDDIEQNFGESGVVVGKVDDTLYGVLFKVSNKSTVWYSVHAFQDAGVAVSETWTWADLTANAKVLTSSGVPAYSIAGADGWTLADLFDNVYLRQAGAENYDRLAAHDISWTDDSVKTALRTVAGVFRNRDDMPDDPLEIPFEESVSNVFEETPKAAMVIEGDFVPTVVDPPNPVPVAFGRAPGLDYDVFSFPSIAGSPPMAVGTGENMVSFNDEPATKAFMQYLTTAEAAQIWARRGWFASLNKNVYPTIYPDVITRKTAGALSQVEAFRYDLSDLQPPAFAARLSELFRDLLRRPGDVDRIADALEEAAKKAYG
jgi:alpha-glucoside transport system substrate-binding protein